MSCVFSCSTGQEMRGTEEGMDKVTKEAIEAASEQAAQDAVEAIKPYFDAKVEEATEKVRHHFDASTEQIISEIKAIGEGDKGNGERLDTHEKRIERLEDHAGLPTFEPAIEG